MYKVKAVVTAADITHDSDVEILNPDLHIATLGKNGHLRMRINCYVVDVVILLLIKTNEKISRLV